jgi:hypothetical protein
MNFGANTDTSGGTRYSEGKPNPMWTPALGLLEVAKVTEYGSRKYAAHDWWVGQSFSTLMGSAGRHFFAMLVYGPLSRDKESGLLHAAHCCWNLLCLLNFVYEGREEELDDLSKWVGVTTAQKQEMEDGS